MNKLRSLFIPCNATDLVVIISHTLLLLLNVIFYPKLSQPDYFIIVNIIVIGAVLLFAHLHNRYDHLFFSQLHYWYLLLVIYIAFDQMYYLVHPIRVQDYDQLLIAADRFLFGFDPTVVLHEIAFPLLTEILQICYSLYYFLPIILILEMLYKHKVHEADFIVFMIIFSFYIYYAGYFMLPAVGPRFTLHDFHQLNHELPGIYLTEKIRVILDNAEYIRHDIPNPEKFAHRDVFPSGHTMTTLLVIILAHRLKAASRYFITIVGVLLIFSTVYLRYHYVVDLIGGIALLGIVLWAGIYLYNKWQRAKGKEELYLFNGK